MQENSGEDKEKDHREKENEILLKYCPDVSFTFIFSGDVCALEGNKKRDYPAYIYIYTQKFKVL